MRGTTFPNLYIMMVGPPGTGKTELEHLIRGYLLDAGVPLAPQHVSKASLMDELKAGTMNKVFGNNLYNYHQLCMLSSEFVETFPAYDIHLLGTLAHWWDCPREVKEAKRHMKEPIIIKDATVSMMVGIQPGLLSQSFPVEAWNGGFLARTIFVYVPQRIDLALRVKGQKAQTSVGRKIPREVEAALKKKLQRIAALHGTVEEDETFVDAYLEWKARNMQPSPKHPRLYYYNLRREHQLEKLSIISAASRESTILTGEDYAQALRWLEGAESNIEDVFVEMSSGDDMLLMQDMHAYIIKAAQGVGQEKLLSETALKRYLTGRVPTQRMDSFLNIAEGAGFISTVLNLKGKFYYAKPQEIVRGGF